MHILNKSQRGFLLPEKMKSFSLTHTARGRTNAKYLKEKINPWLKKNKEEMNEFGGGDRNSGETMLP